MRTRETRKRIVLKAGDVVRDKAFHDDCEILVRGSALSGFGISLTIIGCYFGPTATLRVIEEGSKAQWN